MASIKDVSEAEIYDMFLVKKSAIKMACNAAVTILRVDQVMQIIHCFLLIVVENKFCLVIILYPIDNFG